LKHDRFAGPGVIDRALEIAVRTELYKRTIPYRVRPNPGPRTQHEHNTGARQ
jgi:hypothetical protein